MYKVSQKITFKSTGKTNKIIEQTSKIKISISNCLFLLSMVIMIIQRVTSAKCPSVICYISQTMQTILENTQI